jgi:LPS export ABC transporter protein LptC
VQDKSFHKLWMNNIQNRENNKNNKYNIYKYILKIITILLIFFVIFIIYRWSLKVPNIELLNISKEQNIHQADTLIKPLLLLKNKNSEIITIEAFTAKKDNIDPNIITLEKPNGHYKSSNKKDIYFYSTKGILNNNKEILELLDNVIINSSEGTKFYTDKLFYNTNNNIISSNDKVTINGNWGILYGKGLIYNLESSVIKIKGRPRLSLNSNKGTNK